LLLVQTKVHPAEAKFSPIPLPVQNENKVWHTDGEGINLLEIQH